MSKGLITAGLVFFLVVATFPLWFSVTTGGSEPRPLPEPPEGESECVEAKEYMTGNHMQLLDEWRTDVVRLNKRFYESESGKSYKISLTGTCLKCHSDRDKFCNRCHDYANIEPNCWNCHVDPKGIE